MAVSYNKLFKLLIDKKMKKSCASLLESAQVPLGKWGAENLFLLKW